MGRRFPRMPAIVLCTLLLVASFALSGCGDARTASLFPAPVDGKWGYIDRTGQMVIEPAFDSALPFSYGLAVVIVNDQAGYIDDTGKIVIQPQFYRARGFSDGLASAGRYEAGVFQEGYIDKTGAKISRDFDEAEPLREGFGLVRLGDKWGYVDKTGEIAIPIHFYSADIFSEGLASVRLPDNLANSGYIDKTGAFVIQPQFGLAQPFSEGLAAVTLPSSDGTGYIDKAGAVVIQPQFDMALAFSEGLAVVGMGTKDAIVDEATGAMMPAYGFKKYAYIDKAGKTVIQGEFEDAYSFSDGRARVALSGKYGYIDKTGAVAIPAEFDIAYDFSDGLALVCRDRQAGKWAYVDTTGKMVWTAK